MKFPDLIPCATPGCRSVLDGSRGPTCVVCQKEARPREEGATSTAASGTAVDMRPALDQLLGLHCSQSVAAGGLRVAAASCEDRSGLRVVLDRLPPASIGELSEDPNYFPALVLIASNCLSVLGDPAVEDGHDDRIGTSAQTFTALVTEATRSERRPRRSPSTAQAGRVEKFQPTPPSPAHLPARGLSSGSNRFLGGVSGA